MRCMESRRLLHSAQSDYKEVSLAISVLESPPKSMESFSSKMLIIVIQSPIHLGLIPIHLALASDLLGDPG